MYWQRQCHPQESVHLFVSVSITGDTKGGLDALFDPPARDAVDRDKGGTPHRKEMDYDPQDSRFWPNRTEGGTVQLGQTLKDTTRPRERESARFFPCDTAVLSLSPPPHTFKEQQLFFLAGDPNLIYLSATDPRQEGSLCQ